VPLAVLAVIGGVSLLLRRNRLGLLLILAITIPLVFLMVLAPFFQTSIHYMIVSLPAWMILGAVGLVEVYNQAHKKWGLPIMAGILVLIVGLFFRDRVIRDVLYFYGPQIKSSAGLFTGLGVALLGGVGLLAVGLSVFHRQNRHSLPDSANEYPRALSDYSESGRKNLAVLLWGFVLIPILLLHPLITNHMYYTFQHGYRDNNWKAAMSSLARYQGDEDIILSAMPPVANYYLGERTQDLDGFPIEEVVASGQRVWIVEEYGAYQLKGDEFQSWITENCQRVAGFDRYVRGRDWPMRIVTCPPDTGLDKIDPAGY
jgi:hypothetical protein